MKNNIAILIIFILATALLATEFKRHVDLEKEIQGDWSAAEIYIQQPLPELHQEITSISFQSDNIVEWAFDKEGKMHKGKGRYGIYSYPDDQKKVRKLPILIIVPENYKDPLISGNILLQLQDVELNYDSRFLQSLGKLLKTKSSDGKQNLFIKKQNK